MIKADPQALLFLLEGSTDPAPGSPLAGLLTISSLAHVDLLWFYNQLPLLLLTRLYWLTDWVNGQQGGNHIGFLNRNFVPQYFTAMLIPSNGKLDTLLGQK